MLSPWAIMLFCVLLWSGATVAANDSEHDSAHDDSTSHDHGNTSQAGALNIATDIPPVQSLVLSVVGDLHPVTVLLDGNEQVHHHALKPSDARHVHNADLFIQIGDSLTPWLKEYRKSLPEHVQVLNLNALPQTQTLTLYDEDNNAITDTEDAHSWLNPDNAVVWLDAIRDVLIQQNADNAGIYTANADNAKQQIARVVESIERQLTAVPDHYALVEHDALRYFQTRFGLPPVRPLFSHDDIPPGPAGLRDIRRYVAANKVDCVLIEGLQKEDLLNTVFNGVAYQAVSLDLMGRSLPMNATHYVATIEGVADSVLSCAG